MKINQLKQVETLDEAYRLLNEDRRNVVIAGGAWLKMSSRTVETGIDLSNLSLDYIEETPEALRIGSMTTLRQLETHAGVRALYKGMLSTSISQIMGVGLRNLVTIGGSIIGKYGFSDVLPALLAMETSLVFHSQGEIPLEDFLESKGRINDVLVSINIRKKKGVGYFKKVKQTALAFATLNIAVSRSEGLYKIAIGSRPSVATLAREAMEEVNLAESVDDETIARAAEHATSLKFSSNPSASEDYRAILARVYTGRGLKEVRDCED